MLTFFKIILLGLLVSMIVADYEDCYLAEHPLGNSDEQDEIVLLFPKQSKAMDKSQEQAIANQPTSPHKLKLKAEGQFITSAIFEFHYLKTKGDPPFGTNSIVSIYDGFYCVNSQEKGQTTRACKAYLEENESMINHNHHSLRCFRVVDRDGRLQELYVLNRNDNKSNSLFESIKHKDTHSYAMHAITQLIEHTIVSSKRFLPIIDFNDPKHWLRPNNVIVESDKHLQLHSRFRFIETSDSRPSEESISAMVHQLFFMIKKYLYHEKSCKEVVLEAMQSNLDTYLQHATCFPRESRSVLMALEGRQDRDPDNPATTQSKQTDLLRLVALAYCYNQISYDIPNLRGLKSITSMIMQEDQMFLTLQQMKDFKNYFAHPSKFDETDSFDTQTIVDFELKNYVESEIDTEPAIKSRDSESFDFLQIIANENEVLRQEVEEDRKEQERLEKESESDEEESINEEEEEFSEFQDYS